MCESHHTIGGHGVYAIARCCTGSRVKCHASASLHVGVDAECPSQEYQLTGMSCDVRGGAKVLGYYHLLKYHSHL